MARAVAVEPREPQGHSGEPPTNRLAINLEHGFDDSRVTVKCDRNTVLDERLTTEPSAGVAGYVTCPLVDRSLAPVALTVVIDGQAWQAQIDISKGRVLHLERRQERLRVTQSRNQPLYD